MPNLSNATVLLFTEGGATGGFSFVEVMNLLNKAVIAGGGLWLVWGVIILAMALKNKNGPELQSGIWQVVGGGMILIAATWFSSVAW